MPAAALVTIEHEGITFSMTPEVSALLKSGRLDPDVAYMRGQLKVGGDMARFFDLLPLARSGVFGAR